MWASLGIFGNRGHTYGDMQRPGQRFGGRDGVWGAVVPVAFVHTQFVNFNILHFVADFLQAKCI